jgi:hypothetical protein
MLVIKDIESDTVILRQQIENVNLYHTNYAASEAKKIAYLSLVVSGIAVAVAVWQILI